MTGLSLCSRLSAPKHVATEFVNSALVTTKALSIVDSRDQAGENGHGHVFIFKSLLCTP